MKKSRIFFILLIFTLLFVTACQETAIEQVDMEDKEEPSVEEVVEEEVEEEEDVIVSYLSGLTCEEDDLKKRPVAVMMDNHPGARWQKNINQAEVVFEIPVEGTFTRYMAVYLINEPVEIGSVRSARPYFVSLAYGLNAVYVHAGGSEEAKANCRNWGIVDMDAIVASTTDFWRVDHKFAPHNLYTSFEKIREFELSRYGENQQEVPEPLGEFSEERPMGEIQNFTINYFDDNQTRYEWDETVDRYRRYKDGELHIDESDDSPVYVDNIIIFNLSSQVLDNEGRLGINTVGSGEGNLVVNGERMPIRWEKTAHEEPLVFTDVEGNYIPLKSGNTWIHILDQRGEVIWEQEVIEDEN